MALLVFFLLQTARDLLRVEPLRDQFVVLAVVLLRPLRQHLHLRRLLLLVPDADH